jgi:ATP-dependent DNA helicase RecG
VKDADIISEARVAAEQVLADDPALQQHPGLAAALERNVGMAERAALAKN